MTIRDYLGTLLFIMEFLQDLTEELSGRDLSNAVDH